MWGGMDPHQLMAGGRGGRYYPVDSPHDPRLMFSFQDLHRRYEGAPESAKTKALQTVIEMKASVCVCVFVESEPQTLVFFLRRIPLIIITKVSHSSNCHVELVILHYLDWGQQDFFFEEEKIKLY